MSKANLVTQRDLIRDIVKRWEEQYGKRPPEKDKADILERLKALDRKTCNAEDVARAIGNTSWTELRCDGCRKYVTEAVTVGEEPDYESSTADLCRDCVAEAAACFVGLASSKE
jgi:hypothetical protein